MNIFDEIILRESMIDEANNFDKDPNLRSEYKKYMHDINNKYNSDEEKQQALFRKRQQLSDRYLKDHPQNLPARQDGEKGLAVRQDGEKGLAVRQDGESSGDNKGGNLAQLAAKIAQWAAQNPKLLIIGASVLINVIAIYSATAANNRAAEAEKRAAEAEGNAKLFKMLAAVGLGIIGANLLALGYKLIKHYLTKSAGEVAASNKPKDQKLKTLNGLLSAAQKAVSKAKTADDKQLAQASVDIIQKHINEVQAQG